MFLVIRLVLEDEPLPGRICSRCSGIEFHAIVFKRDSESKGDDYSRFYGSRDSQTSIQLAICIKCHKIVRLQ